MDLGQELDFRVGYKFSDRLRGDLFYADFDGKNLTTDTQKLWVMVSVKL